MVCVRQLGRHREPATRVVFYFAVLGSLVSALPLPWTWRTPEPAAWLVLVAIGALASTLLGWLLWSELPDALSGVGALLVIAAGVTALRERSARAQTL